MADRSNRVVVVGAGLGGLSAACVLAARGWRVTLCEANGWLGGKAAVLERDGFRFDMGPTILTLPDVLARVFAEAGRDLADYLQLVRLDPQWRCFFDDGSVLDLHAEFGRMSETLRQFSPGSEHGYDRFLQSSRRMHETSERFFFWRCVGGMRDVFDISNSFSVRTLRDVLSLRLGSTVAGTVRSHISDPRVAQMLDHFTQYVGSSPEASPAVLCGIAHMQTSGGVWYPRGGTGAVAVALADLAADLGVEVRTHCPIAQIQRDDRGAVSGILTEAGEAISATAVVSNMDSVRTDRELLGKASSRERAGVEPACSGVVLYLGLNKRYGHLQHHNFVFSRDSHEEFDAIYRRGEPAADPTCYLAAPAATDSTIAPAGGEALYVLVHAPYLREHHNWAQMFPEYRRVILTKLATTGGMPDIESRIRFEDRLTPQDILDRYKVWKGAIYGLASHGRWTGAFKPANRRSDIRGLYLAGGSAHPGPGMPMVVMSGWIAADALDCDHGGPTRERRSQVLAGAP